MIGNHDIFVEIFRWGHGVSWYMVCAGTMQHHQHSKCDYGHTLAMLPWKMLSQKPSDSRAGSFCINTCGIWHLLPMGCQPWDLQWLCSMCWALGAIELMRSLPTADSYIVMQTLYPNTNKDYLVYKQYPYRCGNIVWGGLLTYPTDVFPRRTIKDLSRWGYPCTSAQAGPCGLLELWENSSWQ